MRHRTMQLDAGTATAIDAKRATRTRVGVGVMLFFMTAMHYADRATLLITGRAIKAQFGISSVTLGYMFSAFAWTYVLAQLPGGKLPDRFGSKRTYAVSLFCWACVTFAMGLLAGLPAAMAIVMMFVARILIGIAEAPIFLSGKGLAPWHGRLWRTSYPSRLRDCADRFSTVSAMPRAS